MTATYYSTESSVKSTVLAVTSAQLGLNKCIEKAYNYLKLLFIFLSKFNTTKTSV